MINRPKPIVPKPDGPSSLLLLIQYKYGRIDNIFSQDLTASLNPKLINSYIHLTSS